MNGNSQHTSLLQELEDNPEKFEADGKAYDLLQEYFQGLPLETLRPFLKHENAAARCSAAFIAAELGVGASSLIFDVVPLIRDEDLPPRYRSDALDAVMVCSARENFEQFVHVVRELEDCYPSVMRLVANANPSQILAAIRCVDALKPHDIDHQQGLELLLRWNTASSAEVIALLDSPSTLLRKYAAIVAKKRFADCPELIQHAKANDSKAVSTFAEEVLEDSERVAGQQLAKGKRQRPTGNGS